MMAESQGMASDYIKSLLSFLKSNLDSFNHLPVSLKLIFDIYFILKKKLVVLLYREVS